MSAQQAARTGQAALATGQLTEIKPDSAALAQIRETLICCAIGLLWGFAFALCFLHPAS